MRRFRGESAQQDLKFLLCSAENDNKCAECSAPCPTYCSVNLGIFLCGRCASVHRKILGSRQDGATSIVKSLSLDRWSKREVQALAELGGNRRNKEFWNPKNEPFPFDGDDDRSVVEMYIRDKYLKGKFRYTPVRIEDFNLEEDDSQLDPSKSRPSSGSVSRRSRNSSLSAGSRSNGKGSDTPQLPKRPSNTVQEAVFDGTGAPAQSTGSAAGTAPRPALFDGMQQYLDPATGQIYVDQNSYMAAIQQAQLMQAEQIQPQFTQQMQPQLAQQVQPQFTQQFAQSVQVQPQITQSTIDKNTLMSLYNRPDLYTSAVEIKPDNPQYEQIMNLQRQQMQQQQLQQQQLQQQQLQQQQLQQQQLLLQQQYQQQYQQPQFQQFYQ